MTLHTYMYSLSWLYAQPACFLSGLCSPPRASAGTSAWLIGLGSYSGGTEGGSQFLWTKHVDGTCAELSDDREIQLLPQYSGCKYAVRERDRGGHGSGCVVCVCESCGTRAPISLIFLRRLQFSYLPVRADGTQGMWAHRCLSPRTFWCFSLSRCITVSVGCQRSDTE